MKRFLDALKVLDRFKSVCIASLNWGRRPEEPPVLAPTLQTRNLSATTGFGVAALFLFLFTLSATAQVDRRQIEATTYMRGLLRITNAPDARLYLGITGTGGGSGTNGQGGYRANLEAARTNVTLDPFIYVGGYYSENDGGGGVFLLTNTVTSTNCGTRFEIPTTSYSYERWIQNGEVTLKMFGAKGDAPGGSGTDDTASISNCFTYAFANNLPGRIPRGTFKTTHRVNVPSNAKVIGEGPGSIIWGAANDIVFNMAVSTNVLMRDFKLDGAYVVGFYIPSSIDITLDHIEVSGATVAGATLTAGIEIEGCTRVLLDHVYCHDNGVNSTNLAHDYNILVDFTGVPSQGIRIESPIIGGPTSHSKFGIGLYSVADARVSDYYIDMNNQITPHGFTGYALFAYGTLGGPGCNRVSFLNGTITNSADNGIYINNTVGAEVIGNHIAKVAQQGDDTTLAKSGITVTSSANVRVVGNWVTNSGPNAAISLSNSTNCVVEANNIYLPGTNHYGIEIRGYNFGYSIKGNTIWNAHRGIGDVFSNGVSDGGDIEGNVIRNAFDGILLQPGSSNTVIRANRIFNTSDYAILDQGARNIIDQNVIVGGNYGILLAGTNGIVQGNQITGCTFGLVNSGLNYQIDAANLLNSNAADTSGASPFTARMTLTGKKFTWPTTNAVAGQVLASDGADPGAYYWTNSSGGVAGEINTASNLGTQGATIQGVANGKSGVDLRFRSIEAGVGITLTSNATTIAIASSAAGEANTASNLGTPSATIQPWFSAKSSLDLQFREIEAGAGITLTSNANTVAISILPSQLPLAFSDQFVLSGTGSTNVGIASGASLTNILVVGTPRAPSADVGFSSGTGNVNAATRPEWTMILTGDATIGITNFANDCNVWLTVSNTGNFTLTITNICYWPPTGNATQATNDWGAGINDVFSFSKKGGNIIAGKFGLGGGNWLDSGSTNAVLYGNATLNAITATNGVTVKDVAVSKLLRTDSNGKLSAVTIGSGIGFDGTTITGTGVSGWTASAVTNSYLLGNAAVNALDATNGITARDVTASTLLRTDANKKLAAVSIGSNITFDGTTLSANAGAAGNWIALGTTNTFLLGNAAVNALAVTNGITAFDVTASSLVRTDASKKLSPVTVDASLTFDGTTIASANDNWKDSGITNAFIVGQVTMDKATTTNGFTIPGGAAFTSSQLQIVNSGGVAKVLNGSGTRLSSLTMQGGTGVESSLNFAAGGATIGATLDTNRVFNAFVGIKTDNEVITNALTIGAGSSATFTSVGGLMKRDTTATGNVGAGEDNLITYSVPAATLAVNGDSLTIRCAVNFAANGNTKQVKAYFGTTAVWASGAIALNSGDLVLSVTVTRTGAATQLATVQWTSSNASLVSSSPLITTPAETLANAITWKLTGEATTTDDVSQKLSEVWYSRGQ